MQPYHFVLLLFAVYLIHGIYRAMWDVRQETAQINFNHRALDGLIRITKKELPLLASAFVKIAESARYANESFKQLDIAISSKGGQVKDSNEIYYKLKGRSWSNDD